MTVGSLRKVIRHQVREGATVNQILVKLTQEGIMWDGYEPPVRAEDVLGDDEMEDYRRAKATERVMKMRPDPQDPDWFENAVAREMKRLRR